MKKLSIYLDTSVINFLFADDAPAQRWELFMKKNKESKAMLEVWAWKNEAAKTVEHLSVSEAIEKRLDDLLEFEKRFQESHRPKKNVMPRRFPEKARESQTMLDLWEIKKLIASELENLSPSEAIHKILMDSRVSTRQYRGS